MTTPRYALWIAADMWKESVLVFTEGGEVVDAGTFPQLQPTASHPSVLFDFVGRITAYAEQHRSADGTLHIYLGADGGGVDTLQRQLAGRPGTTVALLRQDAPAYTVLQELVAKGKERARMLPPSTLDEGPQPRQAPPISGPGAEAVPDEDQPPGFVSYAKLFAAGQVGGGKQEGLDEMRSTRTAASVIGDRRSEGSVVRVGTGEGQGGQAGATVLRDPGPAAAPPPRQPRFAPSGADASAPSGADASAPSLPQAALSPPPGQGSAAASPPPMVSSALEALEAAVRDVAERHTEEVVVALGAPPGEVDPGRLLLWAMTHGRVEEVLGATPLLAGEYLRAVAADHREAILADAGATQWAEVAFEEIALYLAEHKAELGEKELQALAHYRAALRGRR